MKLILSFTAALFLFAISFHTLPKVSAQTPTVSAVMMEEGEATSPGALMEAVEYYLPYPGILIDHPLFFLKKLRDTILESLISDPLRKTEFYTLQADKYTAMIPLLIEQQKEARVEEVLTIARDQRQKALDTVGTLRSESREVPSYLTDRLGNAMNKHKEVLSSAVISVGESLSTTIAAAVAAIEQQASDLQSLK